MIDVFVGELDLAGLGFGGIRARGNRPAFVSSIRVLLKLYIYGYLNRVQSSRRLEREAGRNVEVIVAQGAGLVPDHKTIAEIARTMAVPSARCVRAAVALCRAMGLLTQASVASTAASSRR